MKSLLAFALLVTAVLARADTNYTLTTNLSYGSDSQQNLDIYQPNDATASPAIVLIHGGGWRGGGKSNMARIASYYAQNGFVVANIDYRLSSPGVNTYPAAVNDVTAAIAWVKSNAATYGIDPNRIAAVGVSVGGYYAAEAAGEGVVNALVDFYGPVDLTDPVFLADTFDRQTNADILAIYLGETINDNPALYAEASPLDSPLSSDPPTLIFHGQLDTVVPVTQSMNFATALRAAGVSANLVILPTAGHSFLTNPRFNASAYLQQSLDFLNTTFGTFANPVMPSVAKGWPGPTATRPSPR